MPIEIYDDKKQKEQSFEALVDTPCGHRLIGYGPDVEGALDDLKDRVSRLILNLQRIDYYDLKYEKPRRY